jgi:hypothetical protein
MEICGFCAPIIVAFAAEIMANVSKLILALQFRPICPNYRTFSGRE